MNTPWSRDLGLRARAWAGKTLLLGRAQLVWGLARPARPIFVRSWLGGRSEGELTATHHLLLAQEGQRLQTLQMAHVADAFPHEPAVRFFQRLAFHGNQDRSQSKARPPQRP